MKKELKSLPKSHAHAAMIFHLISLHSHSHSLCLCDWQPLGRLAIPKGNCVFFAFNLAALSVANISTFLLAFSPLARSHSSAISSYNSLGLQANRFHSAGFKMLPFFHHWYCINTLCSWGGKKSRQQSTLDTPHSPQHCRRCFGCCSR